MGYYNFLNTLNINNVNLETIIEDPNYNNLKQLTEFFIGPKEQQESEIKEPEIKEPEIKEPEDIVKFTSIVLPIDDLISFILSILNNEVSLTLSL